MLTLSFFLTFYVAVDIVISSSVITLYFLFLKVYFTILKIKTKNKKGDFFLTHIFSFC